MPSPTIVEFMPESEGYSCGYCKSTNTNFSDGIWAHIMTVHDYQDLIDLGWRRSGKYCYKPMMKKTCCPLYTIKCEALNFKLSKSQKKILKRMQKFLLEDVRKDVKKESVEDSENPTSEPEMYSNCTREVPGLEEKAKTAEKHTADAYVIERVSEEGTGGESKEMEGRGSLQGKDHSSQTAAAAAISQVLNSGKTMNSFEDPKKSPFKMPKCGVGRDMAKPECKKAKLMRLERKQKKLEAKGVITRPPPPSQTQTSEGKSLEEFFNLVEGTTPCHRLELKLVSSLELEEQEAALEVEFQIYKKYQMFVHHDPPTKCTSVQFKRFLISTPIKSYKDERSSLTYGSFHQQYWLDGQLIAVGVIDILPKCVSSVYFFYDPDYSFLTLGTYGSLREVALVRELCRKSPCLRSYYMGYYIHSCPKMRYKARLAPSFLLCPESGVWVPVEDAVPRFDVSKYSRLHEGPPPSPVIPPTRDRVLVLWRHASMTYGVYRSLKEAPSETEDEEVFKYARLVGRACSERMLLYRES